ncbi:MAG: hypothetical protein XE10_0231 [Methanoculleus marisnigri]|uniref:Uncharacterized protein n=1 Tax=Methanoculleus marisnigri TaxID=2198 RepID=A0A101GS49_9EURY|nr:MAG: hypothetical protein XD82_0182 [Methanoculleus marisnigri]KUL05303.1 MAG: hypothetical protein XE10_0231 [Methanoculleus marisnigri]
MKMGHLHIFIRYACGPTGIMWFFSGLSPYSGPWWPSPLGVGLTGRGRPPPLSRAKIRIPHQPHPTPPGLRPPPPPQGGGSHGDTRWKAVPLSTTDCGHLGQTGVVSTKPWVGVAGVVLIDCRRRPLIERPYPSQASREPRSSRAARSPWHILSVPLPSRSRGARDRRPPPAHRNRPGI